MTDNTRAALNAGTMAAAEAAHQALSLAAINASKGGWKTSEFWVSIGAIALGTLTVGLKAVAVIPGPWSIPAMIAAAAVASGTYALSRGKVKAAALDAAKGVVAVLPGVVLTVAAASASEAKTDSGARRAVP